MLQFPPVILRRAWRDGRHLDVTRRFPFEDADSGFGHPPPYFLTRQHWSANDPEPEIAVDVAEDRRARRRPQSWQDQVTVQRNASGVDTKVDEECSGVRRQLRDALEH